MNNINIDELLNNLENAVQASQKRYGPLMCEKMPDDIWINIKKARQAIIAIFDNEIGNTENREDLRKLITKSMKILYVAGCEMDAEAMAELRVRYYKL